MLVSMEQWERNHCVRKNNLIILVSSYMILLSALLPVGYLAVMSYHFPLDIMDCFIIAVCATLLLFTAWVLSNIKDVVELHVVSKQ